MHSFLPAKEKGVQVDRVYVGSFMTSLEMAGVSITLLHLDETRAHCLGNSCPAFSKKLCLDDSVAKQSSHANMCFVTIGTSWR